MKKLLLLLLPLIAFFTSCISDSTTAIKDPLASNMIEKIETPFRENGYSQYASKIFSSQEKLDKFLTQIGNDTNWNNKTDFLAKVQDTPIDFNTHNLLFYRITEGSGSVKLVVDNNIFINTNKATISIERTVPNIGTDDMAYYALVYKVNKDIKTIVFEDAQQKVVIENKESNMIVPQNCKAWFDGCNYCSQTKNGEGACTEMACISYRPQDFKCTKWEK